MDVSKRLYRVLRSLTEDRLAAVGKFIEQGDALLDEKLKAWEEQLGLNEDQSFEGAYEKSRTGENTKHKSDPPRSSQLIEDLKLFNLSPPSNLQEVKKARNREMKVFHPDKYLNDPERMAIANQIVQIYNDAYERLKASFET
jgi:hypothetical protein